MRRGSSLGRATGLVGLVVAGLAVPPVLGPVPDAASAPFGLHVAFTDERDELWEVGVTWNSEEFVSTGPASRRIGGADHTGEGFWMPKGGSGPGGLVYVSTRGGDGDGEIYLRDEEGDDSAVTCDNRAVETHPVVSPHGDDIAFASHINDNWDIFIATRDPKGSPAPLPAPAGGLCEGWYAQPVTTDPGDDLWPAWSWSADHIVFSSTREFEGVADPLGDLFAVDVDAGKPENEVQRLTLREGADTQPTVSPASSSGLSSPLVAFTSTRDRPDGSLSLLTFEAGASVLPTVFPAWPEKPLQAGEPAFAPTSGDLRLAWTSTESDPMGDVWAGRAYPDVGDGPAVIIADPVASARNVAESHPAWTEVAESDREGTLAFTRRVGDQLGEGGADISEARAVDGSGRRTMVSRTSTDPWGEGPPHIHDEAGPSYSPNGLRVAYSRDRAGTTSPERELVIDHVDGTSSEVVPAGHQSRDIDVDPVWSPDGTRLAFTRYRLGEGRVQPSVWVVDLASGAAHAVSAPPEGFTAVDDLDPAWSPDGTRIALARVAYPEPVVDVVSRRAAPIALSEQPELWVVDAADGGNATRLRPPCPIAPVAACPSGIDGDSPAWSPDGMRIAYRFRDGIRLLTLGDARATGPSPVVALSAVTGFAGTVPTPSRASISASADPAWSPDGSEIAFAGQPAGQPDQRGIYAVRPDGEGLRTIAQDRGPETEPAYGFRPPPPPPADISVTLSLSGTPATAGDPITATYTVRNNGPGFASGVTLATGATPGGTASSTTPGCAPDGSGCPARGMAPGESHVYTVTLTYDGDVDGTASGTVTTGSVDPVPTNNTVEVPFTVRRPADVAVTLAIDGSPALVGQPVTATYTVTNNGPGTATATTLDTTFTAGGSASSTTPGCDATGAGCPSRDLTPGESYEYVVTLTYAGPVDGLASGTVATTASDPDLGNNSVERPFAVSEPADVAVGLTVTGSPADLGDPLTATYTVSNLGPGEADEVILTTSFTDGGSPTSTNAACTADGSGCPARGLAAGESYTYTVTLTYDTALAGFAAGTVTATTADPQLGNNAVEEPFEVGGATPRPSRADVRVAVELDRDLGWVGGTRAATITVTNAGPRLARDVVLETILPGTVRVATATEPCLEDGSACDLGNLAAGATRELGVELDLRRRGRDDLEATASASTADPRPENNVASAALVVRKPELRILPAVGRPGQVLLAYAEDMPPGARVELAWDPGITVHRGPFRVAQDGTLRVPLLLVRHDRLGTRQLTARSVTRRFSPVSAEALVVARLMAPPLFVTRG